MADSMLNAHFGGLKKSRTQLEGGNPSLIGKGRQIEIAVPGDSENHIIKR